MRINLIFVVLGLFGVAIIGQLINVQIVQGEKYKALAEGRLFLQGTTATERGEIFLKTGKLWLLIKISFRFLRPHRKLKIPERRLRY